MDGRPVNINQFGLLTIKLKDCSEKVDTIQLKLGPSLAPLSFLDIRTIHFTADGIDIRDQSGLTLHLRNKRKKATILVEDLLAYGHGKKLVVLWEGVTGLVAPKYSATPDLGVQ